jgi:hypothetical protein
MEPLLQSGEAAFASIFVRQINMAFEHTKERNSAALFDPLEFPAEICSLPAVRHFSGGFFIHFH